jgi:hypothetical protein
MSPSRLFIHAGVQGHLRRHILKQVVVHCRSGYVPTMQDQSNGEGGVPISGVDVEC